MNASLCLSKLLIVGSFATAKSIIMAIAGEGQQRQPQGNEGISWQEQSHLKVKTEEAGIEGKLI